MRYFNPNMTANEVRVRLFDLLCKNRVPASEIDAVREEHKVMCGITVKREMAIASQGWLAEEQ